MNYENRIVLFLDILGFKNIIENTLGVGGKDKPSEIQRLYQELEKIGNFVENNAKLSEAPIIVTQFSDSIIVSFLASDVRLISQLLKTIQKLVINLVNEGFLCRGAISIGKLIHSERVVFGPALNDAYETESKAAMYPRVILDKTIIDLGKKFKKVQTDLFGDPVLTLNKPDESFLRKDTDEKYYIDYFPENIMNLSPQINVQSYLQNLRTIIINGSKSNKPDLKVKYGWMKNKYNLLLKRLTRTENIYNVSRESGLYKYIKSLKLLK